MVWLKQKPVYKIIEIECPECNATGLWSGVYGRDDLARICEKCNGSGKIIINFIPFFMKRKIKNVKHVMIEPGQDGNLSIISRSFMNYEKWYEKEK